MLNEILQLFSKVVITFLLTNIQDVVILMNFFLETSKKESLLRSEHVILGQYLGFSTLLILSLLGYTISYILPVKLFGFLGFVIIAFGLNGLKTLIEQRRSGNELKSIENVILNENESFCEDLKRIVKVSLVTIANGNDNISIYVPIFVQSTDWQIVAYGLGFLFMVGILCLFSYCFIHFPPIFQFARKYAQFISPFVFIALGIYILISSQCFPWLLKLIRTGQWIES
ncbi:unnamed protein product [Adineta ricciae]|uniref:Cadmium resistance transporter n=1 Tax=Adineta ricciae TaxID=249248 RepID=A0A814XFY5_ADIRI|nr:unnamed protein product [Adineta ricciae]